MKCLSEVLLICCVVSTSRSSVDVTPTLEAETAPSTISTLILSASTTTTTTPATTTDVAEDEKHKPSQLPIDLLSTDRVLLDPNVVLARVARDTYGGWGDYRQTFSNPYNRKPFGTQVHYNPDRSPVRPDGLKRRNDVRRRRVASKRFRIYPVFPG